MTREEARLELDATTLRPQDAAAEARAMAADDPELGAWLMQRSAFDERVAEALAPPPPEGLRERLLQNAKRPAPRPMRWLLPTLLASAAAFVLGWTALWPVSGEMPAWQAESLSAVVKVELGMMPVDHLSSDFEAIKKMLIAEQSPSPLSLPGSVSGMRALACKRIEVAGHAASIICFEIQPGKEAHLVVIESSGLEDLPPQGRPEFKNSKNWNMAAWSDGGQTFLLATTADEKELKKLFGAA